MFRRLEPVLVDRLQGTIRGKIFPLQGMAGGRIPGPQAALRVMGDPLIWQKRLPNWGLQNNNCERRSAHPLPTLRLPLLNWELVSRLYARPWERLECGRNSSDSNQFFIKL